MPFVSCENVVMEVVKRAEDSNDIVVRVYECYNRRTEAEISFFKDIKRVYECDLEERKELQEIKPSGTGFKFEIKPYEIKTFRLVL
jgi:alpha-mannosidase